MAVALSGLADFITVISYTYSQSTSFCFSLNSHYNRILWRIGYPEWGSTVLVSDHHKGSVSKATPSGNDID